MADLDPYAGLRIPLVRRFIAGRAVAVIAAQIVTVTAGWQLYARTGSAWALGLVGLVELLPVLLLTVTAGHAADRYPRRSVAMFAYAVLAVAAAALALVSWQDAPVGFIYGILLLVGVGRAFASPSVGTILPQLIEPAQFANVNAWMSSAFELSSIGGPMIGGALIAVTGSATWAYAGAAVGHLIFVGFLAAMPSVRPPPPGPRSARDVFAGFRFIRRRPVFLAAITLDMFAVLLGGAVALVPVFATDILHVGAIGQGALRAAPALGALTMAFIGTRLRPWAHPGRVLLIVVAGFGVATIGFGLSRSFWLSCACLFGTGVFDQVSVVIRLTLEQMITPDPMRGRVAAIHHVFIGFSNELGTFESGATSALVGPTLSVVGGGLGTIAVVALIAVAWPALGALGPLRTLRPEPD